MPTPEEHALLSASSASRWLVCTASPRYEENFPETTSEYAEEGRLAHSFCELKVLKKFTTSISPKTFTTRINKLKKDEKYQAEMEKTSDQFIEHLTELAMSYDAPPYVASEVRVDFSEFVPEGFGTCDVVMIGGDTITIVDYKHGKGVPVSSERNSQMMLYALGALKKYSAIYGDSIKKARLCIDQPRLQSDLSMWETTVDELKDWGLSIKPIAEQAFAGLGEFIPGEHCRFCRGKAQCRARADINTALAEFKDCVPLGSLSPEEAKQHVEDCIDGMPDNTLSDAEIGGLLTVGAELVSWYKDLEEYALKATLSGKEIPGWKCVAGRANRTFTDADAAIKAVIAAGYDESLVYERKPLTLSALETLMGKKEFKEKIGQFVTTPPGKPTLVKASDKRPIYNPAAADFADVVETK